MLRRIAYIIRNRLQARSLMSAGGCRSNSTACWHCGVVVDNLFCSKCNALQKVPASVNFFDIFDLVPSYALESTELTTKFRQLQSVLHPDKFTTKSTVEKEHSDDWSALVNRAYKKLAVPIMRAEYLLELEGIQLPEDNSALDAEFLMEMMERNEEIEEANGAVELKVLIERIKEDINRLTHDLEHGFEEKRLDDVVKILIRMRYSYSIANSIMEKVQKLGLSLE